MRSVGHFCACLSLSILGRNALECHRLITGRGALI